MFTADKKSNVRIYLCEKKELKKLPDEKEAKARGFLGKLYDIYLVFTDKGKLKEVYAGIEGVKEDPKNWMRLGGNLAEHLDSSYVYELDSDISSQASWEISVGWGLGQYQFANYKKTPAKKDTVLKVKKEDLQKLENEVTAVQQAKDWVNTPSNDLNPESFAEIAKKIAKAHKAKIKIIQGEDLLKQNFPMIHVVGKGSHIAPRLVELRWGRKGAKKVSIVGKSVCYDTGGYNLKPSNAMRNMKKDMGGGAIALALADWIMKSKLDMDLQLLLPMVENNVSDRAFVPGNIFKTRSGDTVEIDNTDAEGRLVLCDALTYASERKPDYLIDFATLTGACRVALGPDLPGYFTDNEEWAKDLFDISHDVKDPLWRLPLWKPYKSMLSSNVADKVNSSSTGFAGATTGALYLMDFVEDSKKWIHIDTYCWSSDSKLGSSNSADCQSLRAVYTFLEKKQKS